MLMYGALLFMLIATVFAVTGVVSGGIFPSD